MLYVNRATLLFLLVLVTCLAVGCSEESTGPNNNPPPLPGNYLWSKRFGDGNDQYVNAVAADASGNVIVTGWFEGTVDFGGGALTSAGVSNIFVAKFAADGAHLWSKRFGDGAWQRASAVAVDGSGNVIVTGYFDGTVDFGGGALTSAGNGDIFIAKFGPDGAHFWSKRFGDASDQYACAVAADASGNVIVTGWFDGTVDFGGGALTSAGVSDIFVAKFAADGAHLWSKRFGDASAQSAAAVAADASGNVIVTGGFDGTVDFGGDVLTDAGMGDIFVAKFGSDGAHLWSKRFGDGYWQFARGVAADGSGNVILTGYFHTTVDFDGGALTSAGGWDIFVAELGADGAHLWSKRFGDADDQYACAVAADASGNVIATGYFWGTVDFGGGALTSAGTYDVFVAKFAADGAHLWSKRFGDGSEQNGYAVAADASGNVIVTGHFQGTADFGGGALTSAGGWDIFVAKFGR
jgi:deoxycytidylate deaminase